MNQKTKRRKTMSKKTQFTRSKVKLGSLSWTSPIYPHGEGKYQNKPLKDNIPTNNSVNNLYLGTQKDNMSQASKDGRMIQAKGKDSVHYKGTEIQRSYIPRLINLGFTRKEISEIMNLGVQLVSDYYNKYKETYG